MGYIYPREIRADEDDEKSELAFEWQETLTAPGNGEWILFPNGVQRAEVGLDVTAGEGYIETTLDSLQDVKLGTVVINGDKWPAGNVTVDTQGVLYPCTAFRQVNVSGTTKIKMRMQ